MSAGVGLVYLHGFASGPGSTKARFFGERLAALGTPFVVPELAPDFTHLTVSSMLDVVEPLVGGPSVLIGSSLGGYLATLVAARLPGRVRGLVLFAPAFGFAQRWAARLGPAEVARWRAEGTTLVRHYGRDRDEPLSIELLDDAARYPEVPDPRCPALVFAGRHDDAVPVAAVESFTDGHPERRLVVFPDSGHELNDVLDAMWTQMTPFLRTLGALPL